MIAMTTDHLFFFLPIGYTGGKGLIAAFAFFGAREMSWAVV